jgi:hypothetical protein
LKRIDPSILPRFIYNYTGGTKANGALAAYEAVEEFARSAQESLIPIRILKFLRR